MVIGLKNIKLLLCIGLSLLILGGAKYFFSHPNEKMVRLYVDFNEENCPLTSMKIQGKEYSFVINLGNKFPLHLSKEILQRLEKTDAGFVSSRDLLGEEKMLHAYCLKQVQIGTKTYRNVIAVETIDSSKTCYGEIGRALLTESNLLIDFANSTIIICNDLNKLKTVGYEVKKWAKAPIHLERAGIVLEGTLQDQKVRLGLGTGCPISVIRSTFAKTHFADANDSQFSLNFHLQQTDLGKIHLHSYPITEELQEMDGSIGVDFLRRHAIYLDYNHQIAYLE
ncbi:MAG: hypothetical protein K2P51_05665 [Rhabdochlamydiaceae bacterium]|nr:hypothetical protein [Rhabdochlamydiaceae bacterium]